MALNSWHTPTAREGESKFNHLCYKSPTAVYYVHRWCLGSFAGWQCSACLMPGREQCFSSPGDSGKTLFLSICWNHVDFQPLPFYISFKPTFQQKVKILLQTTFSRGKGRENRRCTKENRLCSMEVKIYCKQNNKYRGIAGHLMGQEMGLLCLKSFHIMETFKG